jgi:hypothetical protein
MRHSKQDNQPSLAHGAQLLDDALEALHKVTLPIATELAQLSSLRDKFEALARINSVKIVTNFDPKPIPLRQFDWSAVDDNYEPGCPIGYGASERDALDDLKGQLEDA